MRKRKKGTLKSAHSRKIAKSSKQAIAIDLSEALKSPQEESKKSAGKPR